MIVVREDCFSQYINHLGYVARPLVVNYEATAFIWRPTKRYETGDRVRARCNSHFNPVIILNGGGDKGHEGWYGLMNGRLHKLVLQSSRPLELFAEHYAFVSAHIGKMYLISDYERELINTLPRQNKIDKLLN